MLSIRDILEYEVAQYITGKRSPYPRPDVASLEAHPYAGTLQAHDTFRWCYITASYLKPKTLEQTRVKQVFAVSCSALPRKFAGQPGYALLPFRFRSHSTRHILVHSAFDSQPATVIAFALQIPSWDYKRLGRSPFLLTAEIGARMSPGCDDRGL